MPNLNSYTHIQSNLFVKMAVEDYRDTPSGSYTSQNFFFSDCSTEKTINGDVYTPLGFLLGISNTSSELRANGDDVTVNISGIPNTVISAIVNSRFKGSTVEIYRGLYDVTTGDLLAVSPNPIGRFFGIVNNYSIQEDYDNDTRTSQTTIVFTCSNLVSVLQNKIPGRKTNPSDLKAFTVRYYSGYSDKSFDRVPNLVGSYFNFGAPL
jgi:hypothetical protein